MITFNELRLSDDRKSMIVDCQIEDQTTHSNAYIRAIYLEYYKNYNATSVYSDKAILVYDNNTESPLVKRVSLTGDNAISDTVLQSGSTGVYKFDGQIFYIIVQCFEDTEEGGETTTLAYSDMGVVIDWGKLYELGMRSIVSYVDFVNRKCDVPFVFQQFVLVFHALLLAINAHDTDMMAKLWSRFVTLGSDPTLSPCNCR